MILCSEIGYLTLEYNIDGRFENHADVDQRTGLYIDPYDFTEGAEFTEPAELVENNNENEDEDQDEDEDKDEDENEYEDEIEDEKVEASDDTESFEIQEGNDSDYDSEEEWGDETSRLKTSNLHSKELLTVSKNIYLFQ